MEFLEVIKKRRSTRKFKDKSLKEEEIEKILRAANLAPSAHNWQSYKIYLVKDQKIKNELVLASFGQEFIAQAPVVLVFVSYPRNSGRAEFYALQDATIACYQAWLAAVDLGLAAVWIGAFEPSKVAEILQIGKNQFPVAILPIGYAGEIPSKTSRKSLSDLVIRK